MNHCVAQLSEAISDFSKLSSKLIDEFGWLGRKGQKKSKVLDATLLALAMFHFNKKLRHERKLDEIIKDVLRLFNTVSEIDLILAILLFWFDKDLLKRSKKIISKSCFSPMLEQFLTTIKCLPRPMRRQKFNGLSLVAFFEYPEELLKRIIFCLEPINKFIFRTSRPHFTILNLGTKILNTEVDKKFDSVADELQYRLCHENYLNNLLRKLSKSASIRDELCVLHDGALVFFGSGDFLCTMHDVRLYLRDWVARNNTAVVARDPQPLWIHTVFARIIKPIPNSQIKEARKRIRLHLHNETIKLEKSKIGFMIFEDRKAILEPKRQKICID